MKARPILRYLGGKWVIANWIISHFPKHRVYVEPYGGAASVLLQKQRSYGEVYNEIDDQIVNLFRVLRERGPELISKLENTPFARKEFELSYVSSRDELEQARRTVIRSFMGFGSASACGAETGFRSNSNRSHTTPSHDWANFPATLIATIERLRGVVIENKDAISVMNQHDSTETLHYVDPPYVLSTRSMKNPYCKNGYRFELSDGDHRSLARTLHDLKGMVILSGYRCPIYEELYAGWYTSDRETTSSRGSMRRETLWINDAASSQISLFRQTKELLCTHS